MKRKPSVWSALLIGLIIESGILGGMFMADTGSPAGTFALPNPLVLVLMVAQAPGLAIVGNTVGPGGKTKGMIAISVINFLFWSLAVFCVMLWRHNGNYTSQSIKPDEKKIAIDDEISRE